MTVGVVVAGVAMLVAAAAPVGAAIDPQPAARPGIAIGGSLLPTGTPESTLPTLPTDLTLPTHVTPPTLLTPGHPANGAFGGSPELPEGGGSSPSAWSVQPSPNVIAKQGSLKSDSCSSASACTAVGGYVNTSGIDVTLAEAWNGTSWSVQATPNPSGAEGSAFGGVSCTSPSACTAVGEDVNSSGVPVALAEKWNGTSWSIEATPDPAGAQESVLDAVSCSSASKCTAVGGYIDSSGVTQPLAEARKGSSWSIDTTAIPPGATASTFNSVACTSANVCTAAGDSENSSGVVVTLAEEWNGTSWSIQATPNVSGSPQDFFYGVACSSAGGWTAVGDSADSSGTGALLAEEWNGTSWSIEATPEPSGAEAALFYGVACTSAGPCTAVGGYNSSGVLVTLAEEWNGTTWSAEATPNPSGALYSILSGVACTSTGPCTAVGYSFNKKSVEVTLADAWNGTTWSVQATPNVSGAQDSVLLGVACTAASACTAVGLSIKVTGAETALAEAWNGNAWSVEKLPKVPGARSSGLTAVACTSANRCTAVGESTNSSDVVAALAEVWNGTSWTVEATPDPSGALDSVLTGVSCTSAGACTAVGSYTDGSNLSDTLAETWNGTSWSIQTTPNPSGAQDSYLSGVSCTAGDCTAVGNYTDGSGGDDTLAETWNGSSWSIQTTPNPSGAQDSSLSGVSCTAGACTAVGNSDGSGALATLAEVWNGTSWSIQSTPVPSGAEFSGLLGVACTSAGACTAVGDYTDSSGVVATLAEAWDGTSWSIQATPNPLDAQSSALNGVACTSTTGCSAVGQSVTPASYITLVEVGPSP